MYGLRPLAHITLKYGNPAFWEDRLRLWTSFPLMNSVLFFIICYKLMEPCFFNVKYFFHNSGYPIVNGKIIRQMYVGPHTKYQLFCPLLTRIGPFTYINNKTLIQNFMKIHPLVVLCWGIDRCDEANSFFVQLLFEPKNKLTCCFHCYP